MNISSLPIQNIQQTPFIPFQNNQTFTFVPFPQMENIQNKENNGNNEENETENNDTILSDSFELNIIGSETTKYLKEGRLLVFQMK